MDATMETYTKIRTETEDVSYTATTITTTITAPPTPTMTIFRRDDAPVPWYLRRKCNRRQLHAACRNIIEQYPSTTVTRTRTRTAYERPTIFSTRTYTRWRVTRTTTTTYLSTSTVTAIETSTVPHPCDDPSNTIRRVLAAGVRGSNITPEENGESIGATECCRRCWDESQCNGWAYFDGWHCLRMVSVPSTGTTETCPNGFPDWTVMTSASGVDQDVSGQGPCARIMEEDE
ncbi:hypothetical protein K440DRAFT_90953 [Wilcoxina mikolae CBS 423.85]|nr:hypothetical protein K440DRAFT_90953 [Wilcoxina mikolae CBS 423.85]